MGLFDSIVSGISAEAAKKEKEERKRVHNMDDYQLKKLYKDYIENDQYNHWQAKIIREEMVDRGMEIPT